MDSIVSIILFVISFGVLICIHELGHLSMAKLFGVYCKEYSIGFGPALFSNKRKGKETKISIRAIPLGGYVSMYGEQGADADPDFKDIPVERSLDGVKKWKKGVVVSAGVILNAFLALILIGVSDICFPLTYYTRNADVAQNSIISEQGIKEDDQIQFVLPEEKIVDGSILPFSYQYTDDEKVIHAYNFYIVDSDVEIKGTHYSLTFMYGGNKGEPVFTQGLSLRPAVSKADLASTKYTNELFKSWAEKEDSPEYYPNIEENVYALDASTTIDVDLAFKLADSEEIVNKTITLNTVKNKRSYVFVDIGLSFKTKKVWQPFGTRIKYTFQDFGSAASAVFDGLGVLFSGGIKNMSGIVGIYETSASLYSNYSFATYLYFWGLISVNLAIFNLLPFPGLDGWQLLVTIIEGITKKKLPAKFKTIMSLIGLAILFILMIAIVGIDILRIVG